MMLNPKHILICILVAVFVFTLPACSIVTDTKAPTSATSTGSSNYKAPDMPDYVEHEPPAGMGFDISNEDIFEKGYYAVQYDTFSGAYFSWSSTNNSDSDIEWSVYVSDNELSEDEIKVLSETKSLGVNEGSDEVARGQWIIVICNINKETADAPIDSTSHLYSYRDYA